MGLSPTNLLHEGLLVGVGVEGVDPINSVCFDSVHLGRGGEEEAVLAGLRLDILPSICPFVGTFNSCGTNTLDLTAVGPCKETH